MKRGVSLFLVAVMVASLVVGIFPATAAADPVTLYYASEAAMQAGLAAAGASYGTQSRTSLQARGLSNRDISGLTAALLSQGVLRPIDANSNVTWGQLMAAQAGMQARGTWAAFSAAANSMWSYGSYAWMNLADDYHGWLAIQAAASGDYTYTSSGAWSLANGVQLMSATTKAMASASGVWTDQVFGANGIAMSNYARTAFVKSGVAGSCPFRVELSSWSEGDSVNLKLYKWDGSPFVTGTYYVLVTWTKTMNVWWVPGSSSAAIIQAAVNYGAAQPREMPASPTYYPPLRLVPPLPPEDPQYTPPDPTPVPIPWIGDPSKIGVPDTTKPAVPPAPGTTATPVPYVPPIGTDKNPVPDVGLPLPGKKARDAATALDAAVPDMLGWLKAPFIAILGWLADLFDWLQATWNQFVAWLASWVIPSDAGLAAAWTVPWSQLQLAASTRWPFAIGTVFGTLVNAVLTPGTAAHGLPALGISTSVMGMPFQFDFNTSLQPLQSWKWFGDALAWVWLVVSLIVSFRPRVVT